MEDLFAGIGERSSLSLSSNHKVLAAHGSNRSSHFTLLLFLRIYKFYIHSLGFSGRVRGGGILSPQTDHSPLEANINILYNFYSPLKILLGCTTSWAVGSNKNTNILWAVTSYKKCCSLVGYDMRSVIFSRPPSSTDVQRSSCSSHAAPRRCLLSPCKTPSPSTCCPPQNSPSL